MKEYDLIIIGSGPGGYTGAIRAAQLGMKVLIIEKDNSYGGTCANVGCIPSKALLDSSEHFHAAKQELSSHGVKLPTVELDLPTMMKRKNTVVGELTKGIAFLLKKNKIQTAWGHGKVLDTGKVEVKQKGKTEVFYAKNIMLATGSNSSAPSNIPTDGKYVVSSTEALCFETVPQHLIVIGGGAIGLELGSVWLRLGAKVSVVEFADTLCGNMDRGMTKELEKILKKQGFEFYFRTGVTSTSIKNGNVEVHAKDRENKEMTLQGNKVLVATGRRAFSEGLGLEALGIETNKQGVVRVNQQFETNRKNIYAIGDLIRGPMLAHKAEEEGVAVAEIIATGTGHVNYNTVPSVVYTWPELASVGKTEEELKAENIEYSVGKFPFLANGRAKALGSSSGSVKILADAKTDLILGAHILGPRASDLIGEAVMAMEFGASSEDMARCFHAHPTLSETLREAALGVDKRTRQL